ncbi:MAG: hypothetical protein ACKVIN_04555 [Longimicrobiales bacterium]
MNAIASAADTVLRGHPHPTLPLSDLVERVASEVDRSATADRVRLALNAHPEHFRVIDIWTLGDARNEAEGGAASRSWVVSITEPWTRDQGASTGATAPDRSAQGRTLRSLSANVRWLARHLDSRSRMAVGRWAALTISERSAREAVCGPAPALSGTGSDPAGRGTERTG